MKKTIKNIAQVYYIIYATTIISTVVGYMINLQNHTRVIDPKSAIGISLSSILILYILISIPLALGGFHRMTKKWLLIDDEKIKLAKYEKGAILRLAAIGTGLIGSVVAFYLMNDISMIYCVGITAIALLFCKPTEAKIESDLKLNEKED
jgi:hypothetical protein